MLEVLHSQHLLPLATSPSQTSSAGHVSSSLLGSAPAMSQLQRDNTDAQIEGSVFKESEIPFRAQLQCGSDWEHLFKYKLCRAAED